MWRSNEFDLLNNFCSQRNGNFGEKCSPVTMVLSPSATEIDESLFLKEMGCVVFKCCVQSKISKVKSVSTSFQPFPSCIESVLLSFCWNEFVLFSNNDALNLGQKWRLESRAEIFCIHWIFCLQSYTEGGKTSKTRAKMLNLLHFRNVGGERRLGVKKTCL